MGSPPLSFPDFPLFRVRFKAGSLGLTLPDYAGGMMRGGFGMALRRVSPVAFNLLFGNDREDGLFVPYMLVPPIGGAQVCMPGETFEFELRLFGSATAHLAACSEALTLLGKLGIGRERGKFVLLAASNVLADKVNAGEVGFLDWKTPDRLIPRGLASEWLVSGRAPVGGIRIDLETPLRLKSSGHLLGEVPPFGVMWRRLYARIALAAGQAVLDGNIRKTKTQLADAIVTGETAIRWQDWTRYSARQGTEMKFGGLVGSLQYHGELTDFLPWLNLGTALGIGGKTTFGLGCYRLTV